MWYEISTILLSSSRSSHPFLLLHFKTKFLQFMLYGWGFVYPSFIQKAAAMLLQDIQAAGRGELDLREIERLANVYLSRSF